MLVFIMTILLSDCTHEAPALPHPLLSSILLEPQPICKHGYPLTPYLQGLLPQSPKGHPLSLLSMDGASGSTLWTLHLPVWVLSGPRKVSKTLTTPWPAYSPALQQQDPVLGAAGEDNGLPSSPSSWRPTLSPAHKGKPSADFCGGDYCIVSLSRYGAPQGMLCTKRKRNLWACSLPSSNPNPEHETEKMES